MEVAGIKKHRVERLLRGDAWIGPAMFPFGINLVSHTDLDFRVERSGENKRLAPKRFGKQKEWKKNGAGGRPYKLIAITDSPSPLQTLFEELTESEKGKLESYLASQLIVDLYKSVLIKLFSLNAMILKGENLEIYLNKL